MQLFFFVSQPCKCLDDMTHQWCEYWVWDNIFSLVRTFSRGCQDKIHLLKTCKWAVSALKHHACMSSPSRTKSHTKPTFVVVMWRAESGIWQGRVKALPDGREQLVSDMRELVTVVENLQEVQHAKSQSE